MSGLANKLLSLPTGGFGAWSGWEWVYTGQRLNGKTQQLGA